jgi:hypothetical protein
MCVKENTAEFHVVKGLDAKIEVCGDDVVRFPGGDHRLNLVDSLCCGNVIKRYPKECDRKGVATGFYQGLGRLASKERLLDIFGHGAGRAYVLIRPHNPSEMTRRHGQNGE